MNLAEKMRMVTSVSQNENEEFQKLWSSVMRKIQETASKGKNEICFYDLYHPAQPNYSRENREMLIDKLKRNGFRYEKGFYLGKGMGSWETPFVVW